MSTSLGNIYQSIEILSKEKGIDPQIIRDAVKDAMLVAARKHFHANEELVAEMEEGTGALQIFGVKRVVDPVTDPDKLAQAYSPTTLRWLDRLALTDIFHAWWFLILMGLVSLSIVLVSIDRFPNAWRFYARPYRKTDSHFRGSLPKKIELPINTAPAALSLAMAVAS